MMVRAGLCFFDCAKVEAMYMALEYPLARVTSTLLGARALRWLNFARKYRFRDISTIVHHVSWKRLVLVVGETIQNATILTPVTQVLILLILFFCIGPPISHLHDHA